MSIQLFELIDREYRAVIKQRDAEYRALQSQIQPHFLYNTLNGFIGLNRIGERKGLEKAILSLSSMLRYILEQKDISTLKEEFFFLEKYCELQQIRFQEKLNFKVVCEEAVTELRIPKLLLQPLVENAIIHGVEPLNRPCLVTIIARLDTSDSSSKIVIEVVDNGLGFNIDEEKANARIGIANVSERIRLFFPQATLRIESNPGNGTKVTIEIPS
jgi:two-component system sensor histidine kinase YesM